MSAFFSIAVLRKYKKAGNHLALDVHVFYFGVEKPCIYVNYFERDNSFFQISR